MKMLCQSCYKTLRSNEGIKCGKCDSRFHYKCVKVESKGVEMESGDRKYHWTCASCQRPASKTDISIDSQVFLNAINAITEKMELVNKLQLPKLSNDLTQIKIVTDRIVKQNEDILQKIDQLNARKQDQSKTIPTCCLRRRNLNLSPRTKLVEVTEQAPILGTDSLVRYRTRRRSYPLLKMLLQLNRRLRRSRTPRK